VNKIIYLLVVMSSWLYKIFYLLVVMSSWLYNMLYRLVVMRPGNTSCSKSVFSVLFGCPNN